MEYHFAQLDINNIVVFVTPIDIENCSDSDGNFDESIGIQYCKDFFGEDTNWKRTTQIISGVSTSENVVIDNFRGNFASIGMTYMTNVATLGVASTDIFIDQQPYSSWSISTSTPSWIPPIAEPIFSDEEHNAEVYYEWDESAYQEDSNNPKIKGWVLNVVEESGADPDDSNDLPPDEGDPIIDENE